MPVIEKPSTIEGYVDNIKSFPSANPLDTPPFEAYGVTCGVTFPFGGLHIDGGARVLDVAADPIPGLYAAGELVGGLFYFNYPGGTGLTAGAVFGRLAGSAAAAQMKPT